MYKLAVGALFKNESHSMKEWIEHYLSRGVEHFYLINDQSTDNFMEILQQYIDQNKVTLFNAVWNRYLGRQKDMYNHYILPRIKETKWLLMIDLDEYVWSPHTTNFNTLLDQCNHIGQIQIYFYQFGSNGIIEQPSKIVDSFTKRSKNKLETYKYFVNSDYEFSSLNVHHATFVKKEHELKNFMILDHFHLNHYSCQSRNFWIETKMTRGDSNEYMIRDMSQFNFLDTNDVEDTGLIEQNKQMKEE